MLQFTRNKAYISEFVYGGIDGAITTFAVVAGSTGANFEISVIIILGFANLLADGFSMSVGNFFSTKASNDLYGKHRKDVELYVKKEKEKAKEEISRIYAAKGFKGELLEQVVSKISGREEVWVDTLLKERQENPENRSPFSTAAATFISFFMIGLIPLLMYVFSYITGLEKENLFIYSCILTGVGLAIVGNMKSRVTEKNRFYGIFETLALGGIAALLAYFVGDVLEKMFL